MPKDRNGLPISPKKLLQTMNIEKQRRLTSLLLRKNPDSFLARTNKWLPMKPPIYNDIIYKEGISLFKGSIRRLKDYLERKKLI